MVIRAPKLPPYFVRVFLNNPSLCFFLHNLWTFVSFFYFRSNFLPGYSIVKLRWLKCCSCTKDFKANKLIRSVGVALGVWPRFFIVASALVLSFFLSFLLSFKSMWRWGWSHFGLMMGWSQKNNAWSILEFQFANLKNDCSCDNSISNPQSN